MLWRLREFADHILDVIGRLSDRLAGEDLGVVIVSAYGGRLRSLNARGGRVGRVSYGVPELGSAGSGREI
jgi:hypothetical protein